MNLQLHLPSIKSDSLKQSRSSPANVRTDYLTFLLMFWPLSAPPCSSAVVLLRLRLIAFLTDEGSEIRDCFCDIGFFINMPLSRFLRFETSSRTIQPPPPPAAPEVGAEALWELAWNILEISIDWNVSLGVWRWKRCLTEQRSMLRAPCCFSFQP